MCLRDRTRDQSNTGRGGLLYQQPPKLGHVQPRIRATNAAAVDSAGTGPHQTCVTVNINMTWHHPKYYKELRKRNKSDQAISDHASTEVPSVRPGQGRKPTSSQASSAQAPSRKPKAQASSQTQQDPGSENQGTSAQAHEQGYKQQE